MESPVTISNKAIEEIKHIMGTKKIPQDYGLRVGVKGGACGASFILGFDKKTENDQEFIIDGVPVYIRKKDTMFIIGKEVDFYDGADQRGFVFIESSE